MRALRLPVCVPCRFVLPLRVQVGTASGLLAASGHAPPHIEQGWLRYGCGQETPKKPSVLTAGPRHNLIFCLAFTIFVCIA